MLYVVRFKAKDLIVRGEDETISVQPDGSSLRRILRFKEKLLPRQYSDEACIWAFCTKLLLQAGK